MRGNPTTPRVSIIGLGNVLLGDDGVGCLAVELFRCQYKCGPEVEIIDAGTPGLDLAPYLYGRELVVIVDAVTADGKPGTVGTYRESDFLDSRAQLRLTDHDPGLEDSLAQLRLAGRGPSEVVVVGVIPESCVFGGGMSSTVLAATSLAIDTIIRVLLEHGFDCQKRLQPMEPKLWWICDCTEHSINHR
ncbi:MAG TPA: hydrogenase maturation protease [Candidatus Sulfotelmatobacter sp.]|nr:hydrogenase maturation protease [Candidatus Sulfotelmatobacter sp.]